MSSSMQAATSVMPLKYPMSVALYPTYAEAQRAVDHLSDNGFPVENLCIVGTELKQVERVTGRLTWGQVLARGALSGLGNGIFLGLMLGLFMTNMSFWAALGFGAVLGLGMGLITAGMAHAATGGQRDFNSVQAIVATRYEVLGEREVVEQARQMLGQGQVPQRPSWPSPGGDQQPPTRA